MAFVSPIGLVIVAMTIDGEDVAMMIGIRTIVSRTGGGMTTGGDMTTGGRTMTAAEWTDMMTAVVLMIAMTTAAMTAAMTAVMTAVMIAAMTVVTTAVATAVVTTAVKSASRRGKEAVLALLRVAVAHPHLLAASERIKRVPRARTRTRTNKTLARVAWSAVPSHTFSFHVPVAFNLIVFVFQFLRHILQQHAVRKKQNTIVLLCVYIGSSCSRQPK
mmetsp:Transcript_6860/g.12671  ORF Transcript_6860/g.12671 Transcript_6860/m.12671 type:complete len:217 (+) Transcript_6860:485-1135(+)